MDTASLLIVNDCIHWPFSLWTQYSECQECPLVYRFTINPLKNKSIILNTNYHINLEGRNVSESNETFFSLTSYSLTDQAKYQIKLTCTDDDLEFKIKTLEDGRNNLWPIMAALLIYTLIIIGWKFLFSRFFSSQPGNETKSTKKRIGSLDAFRGLTIAMMIFANYGSGGYAYLDHVPWFGINMADFIFPWFIFIMGMSISFSIKRQYIRTNRNALLIWKKIIIRSIKLFVIGLVLNSDYSTLSHLRVPGVLQRFSISYFVSASLRIVSIAVQAKLMSRPNTTSTINHSFKASISLSEALIYFVFILFYIMGTFALNYDDQCPKGYQGPGGLHLNASYFNCTGGAANYLDKRILGENHLYKKSTSEKLYSSTMPHDPEGILGTATSIFLTGIGVYTGHVLTKYQNSSVQIILWLGTAVVLGLATCSLVYTNLIPICKNLWSLSFVTYTGSMGLIVFTACYLLIDTWKIWDQGKPFNYPGLNSILIYIGHSVGGRYLPFYYHIENSSHALLLFRDCVSVSIWIYISYILFKKKIFFAL